MVGVPLGVLYVAKGVSNVLIIQKCTLKLKVNCFFFPEWLKNVLKREMLCCSKHGDGGNLKEILTVQASVCSCSVHSEINK